MTSFNFIEHIKVNLSDQRIYCPGLGWGASARAACGCDVTKMLLRDEHRGVLCASVLK